MNSNVAETAAKISVSIPHEVAAAARKRAGARGLSGFVTQALMHELEREKARRFLAALDEKYGPVSKGDLARARRAWRKR
jgi:post-segregation antitoxin (ccd killing protein)